ncbi:glycoside hydrolase family 2 TIM barrel-domain containing protein [Hymenobacter sp. BT491]|uniref:glycoside hydrolase family 2 TIM barrel-domain containing protein n=1 Tax=Hymenobacter sp. BT491 TaxID=2766779 RepID=UPI001653B407|nr:glycoside hydrolase family 2 TIM barrel-domain containing protein [Hymenobacter sp. BT491]MBC6990095.1 hypothetical protein [Hymenobacter sp. BT491]
MSEADPREVASKQNLPMVVKVARTAKGFQLLCNGKPFQIKGAAGYEHYDLLHKAGGNSVRLWSTDYASTLLDEAERNQLKVTLGLWMGTGQQGFDYYDKVAVKHQLAELREQVLRYRNHPALLMWGVSNELDNTSKGRVQVWEAVEEVARMVHELDPNHPTVLVLSSALRDFALMRKTCPSIDIIATNAFRNLYKVPLKFERNGWDGPYLITEFGAAGYWESQAAEWKTAFEQSSSAKAEFVRLNYENVIANNPRCLGSYVFYWGQKQEYTSSWFSTFSATGQKTALADEMQHLWTGRYPANRAPYIGTVSLNKKIDTENIILKPNTPYQATITAFDPENDPLTIRWSVVPDYDQPALSIEPAELHTAPLPVPNAVQASEGLSATIRTPAKAGPYRLMVTVADDQGSIGTANVPFYVGKLLNN